MIQGILIFITICIAYEMGKRDTAKKFSAAVSRARELYDECNDEPVHRIGALRFIQVLVAQLHEKGLS